MAHHSSTLRPRVILVEEQGQLRGLISIKDILKEIIAHEQLEERSDKGLDAELDATLEEAYEWFQARGQQISRLFGLGKSRGVRLNGTDSEGGLPMSSTSAAREVIFDARDAQPPSRPSSRLGNPFEMRR